MMESSRRTALTTRRLRMMFVEASMAKGTTSREPIAEPSRDILIVSNSGCQTWDRYPQSGGSISPRITKNSRILAARIPISKPVTFTERAVRSTTASAQSGALDRYFRICFPFGSSSTLGGRILSYSFMQSPPPSFPDKCHPGSAASPERPGRRTRSFPPGCR